MWILSGMLPSLAELTKLLYWVGASSTFMAVYEATKREYFQSDPDLCCHVYLRGLPGCGKTSLIFTWFIERADEHGQCIIATKDVSKLLDYFQERHIQRVILLQPHAKRPRGVNMLRCYTDLPVERQQIADDTVDLFKKLYKQDFGNNMQELIKFSVLAVLEYADQKKCSMTLFNVYKFLENESYRTSILREVRNQFAKDAFADPNNSSILATLRKLRMTIGSDYLITCLCQDDIDLEEAVTKRMLLLCDFDEGFISETTSNFLARIIVSKLQLICNKRKGTEPVYFLYLDEFQNYLSSSIAKGIFMLRSRRVSLHLSHQDGQAQLDSVTNHAAMDCGTLYFFQQGQGDVKSVRNVLGENYKKFDFTMLPSRRYVGKVRMNGGFKVMNGRTKDLPHKAEGKNGKDFKQVKEEIISFNSKGKTHEELKRVIFASVQVERDMTGDDE